MEKARIILEFYFFGILISLFVIGLLYLYSHCFEPHFRYAEWSNMLQTIMISGIPFGFAVWAINYVRIKW